MQPYDESFQSKVTFHNKQVTFFNDGRPMVTIIITNYVCVFFGDNIL